MQSENQTNQNMEYQLMQKELESDNLFDDDLKCRDELSFHEQKLEPVSDNEMKEERLHNFLVAIICLPTSGSSEIKGSGVLISKDLVLTCAHNFYYGTELAEKNKVKVYVAPCGEQKSPQTVQDIYIPYEYRAKKKASYDYALVKLKLRNELTNLEGFIPLKCEPLQKIRNQLIAIYGYPEISYTRIKYQKYLQVVQMGLMIQNRILQIKNGILYHKISTLQGHSGSPLILIEKTKNKKEPNLHIVAIHKGFVTSLKKNIDSNYARFLTNKLIKKLKKQAERMKAQPFIINKYKNIFENKENYCCQYI